MEPISFIGVIVGLTLAIFLIIRKLNPVSAMFLGAITGAIVGGAGLTELFSYVIVEGAQMVMGTVLRIIACGVLAGVLIESGAAESIARGIIEKMGEKRALLAMAIASMIIVAAGVFPPVSVVILAPVALSVSCKANVSKFTALLALSGGAKAGNIISPNPNTIAAAASFDLPLSEVMIGGFIPALFALITTIILCNMVQKKQWASENSPDRADIDFSGMFPPFKKAIIAPATAISLLMLAPVGSVLGIELLALFRLDAFYVLPFGAVAGAIAMGKMRNIVDYTNKGMIRIAPIVLMLIGAGALTSLILHSDFPDIILMAIYTMGIPEMYLAPISGTIMGTATGSATASVMITSNVFSHILISAGVPALSAAVTINVSANFLDIVPHGGYFLASQDSMKFSMAERLRLIPYEAVVGGVMTVAAVIMHYFMI